MTMNGPETVLIIEDDKDIAEAATRWSSST
jgi:hypothetical protein